MSKLLSVKIDVTKIPKERLYEGKKGTYLDIDIWINDEDDQYGYNCSASIKQSKEERDAKERKIYLGNGKTVFGFDDLPASKPRPNINEGWEKEDAEDEEDDIPF